MLSNIFYVIRIKFGRQFGRGDSSQMGMVKKHRLLFIHIPLGAGLVGDSPD